MTLYPASVRSACGGGAKGRIYFAECIPVCYYYTHGRKNSCARKEEIALLAAHQATMVIFLSTGMLEQLSQRLLAGGYQTDTPAAIVYKATWNDEKVCHCTVATLAQTEKEHNITKQL